MKAPAVLPWGMRRYLVGGWLYRLSACMGAVVERFHKSGTSFLFELDCISVTANSFFSSLRINIQVYNILLRLN
jgi:hypothetical protein